MTKKELIPERDYRLREKRAAKSCTSCIWRYDQVVCDVICFGVEGYRVSIEKKKAVLGSEALMAVELHGKLK